MSIERELLVETTHGKLHAQLKLPEHAEALVLVIRGGDPHGPDAHVATALLSHGLGVMELDLITTWETHFADSSQNVHLHALRLLQMLDYLHRDADCSELPIGIFAFGAMAASAVRAAAQRDMQVRALVVVQGHIDNAGLQYLEALRAALLVLLLPEEEALLASTQRAFIHLSAMYELEHVDEAGMAHRVVQWFRKQLLTRS